MIDIAKKKLPTAVMTVLVYISYCAMSWYVMRGSMAYYGESYGFSKWFTNDIWSFFLGGIVPTAVYIIISSFTFRMIVMRAGKGALELRYGLNYAVIAANLVLFAIKFIYLAAPLYAPILNIILDPTVTVAFVGLYMYYAFKQEYVDKSIFRYALTQIMGAFIAVYGVLALINMMLAAV